MAVPHSYCGRQASVEVNTVVVCRFLLLTISDIVRYVYENEALPHKLGII